LDGLESLLEEIGRAGLPVQLHIDGEPGALPRGIDLSAYRIVQEGLTNALKHARASNADVTVRYRPDELHIEVRDNGDGSSTSNGLEAVHKAARFQPTVVLMDIRMPELDGLQATRRILAADNDARILILTTFDLDEYVYEALRAGASGFVLKDDPPEQLLAAV